MDGLSIPLTRATALIRQRLGARIEERERIARDLHDTLLQSVQGLALRLQVVDDLLPAGEAKEQLDQSLDRMDQAIAEGRRAVQGLRSIAAPVPASSSQAWVRGWMAGLCPRCRQGRRSDRPDPYSQASAFQPL